MRFSLSFSLEQSPNKRSCCQIIWTGDDSLRLRTPRIIYAKHRLPRAVHEIAYHTVYHSVICLFHFLQDRTLRSAELLSHFSLQDNPLCELISYPALLGCELKHHRVDGVIHQFCVLE